MTKTLLDIFNEFTAEDWIIAYKNQNDHDWGVPSLASFRIRTPERIFHLRVSRFGKTEHIYDASVTIYDKKETKFLGIFKCSDFYPVYGSEFFGESVDFTNLPKEEIDKAIDKIYQNYCEMISNQGKEFIGV